MICKDESREIGAGSPSRISLGKKLLFSLVSIVLMLAIVELVASVIYYQKHGEYQLAAVHAFNSLAERASRRRAKQQVESLELPAGSDLALFTEMGKTLLGRFSAEYESEFAKMVNEAQSIGSKLIVLYLPAYYSKEHEIVDDYCRPFFSELAGRYNAGFIDLTDYLRQYDQDAVYLMPFDAHLSRYGNYLIAKGLVAELADMSEYRTDYSFDEVPAVLGDLAAGQNNIWNIKPDAPYRVVTNKYGFRMGYDFELSSEKQKILILGDSWTFGPYLANHDTYPGILDRLMDETIVINAGIAGYTIYQESALFMERAKYVAPDITILQVLDNDLTGLFSYKIRAFDRNEKHFKSTEAEIDFLEAVRSAQGSQN